MSKRENHWYIASSTLRTMAASFRWRGRASWLIFLVLLVPALVQLMAQPGWHEAAPLARAAPLIAGAGALIGMIAWIRRFRAKSRGDILAALQQPTPDQLMNVHEAWLRRAAITPDAYAMVAHGKAVGLAFYGRQQAALLSLAGVRWEEKAPLIQAMGVSAEGLVELLCRRAPARAVELTRRARALAAVGAGMPGAAQSARVYDAYVAVSEVVAGEASPVALEALRKARTLDHVPTVQLLACLGLALDAERAGDPARSAELRQFIARTAPHCRPLALGLRELAGDGDGDDDDAGVAEPGPVSAALDSDSSVGAAVMRQQATGSAQKMVGKLVGLWALLIVAFLVVNLLLRK